MSYLDSTRNQYELLNISAPFDKKYDGFSLVQELQKISLNEKNYSPNSKTNALLYDNASMTVGNLAAAVKGIVSKYDLGDNVEGEFFGLLKNCLPLNSNLPIIDNFLSQKKYKSILGTNKYEIIHIVINYQYFLKFICLDKFTPPDFRLLRFQVCPNLGCLVFVGKKYKELNHCPNNICKAKRFNLCGNASCSQHNNRNDEYCGHTRTPKKELYYRPIIPWLTMLLSTKGFVHCINYQMVKRTPNVKISDIKDGKSAKYYLEQMNNNFKNYVAKYDGDEQRSNNIVEVSLLLSVFYDGIQVSKRAFTHFWPLMISIVNLPPNYRNVWSVGMNLLSIMTSKYS
jgi:hypothetical protein